MIVDETDHPGEPLPTADRIAVRPWELGDEATAALCDAVPSAESIALNALMDPPLDAHGKVAIYDRPEHRQDAPAAVIVAAGSNAVDDKPGRSED